MSWSDILNVAAIDAGAHWGDDDLAALLRLQLAAGLEPGGAGETFGGVLFGPAPSAETVGQVERFFDRESGGDPNAPPLPAEVVEVLRLACLAASARAGLAAGAHEETTATRLDVALARQWLDDATRGALAAYRATLTAAPIRMGAPSTTAAAAAAPASLPQTTPLPLRVGRYVVERPHAQGGLGVLSVAQDVDLGRPVALKEIRPELRDEPASRGRFVREARITGQLEHPNIVPVYALGRDERGNPYYAMRFVGGRTLGHAIDDYHRHPDRAILRDLLRRFGDVCRAMAYAHSREVVHRDLKPANVMLGDFGETWVVDWGIAKRLSEPESPEPWPSDVLRGDAEQTLAGQALGTPRYMAPEQAADARQAVPASDVYSLGAILLELVAGPAPRGVGVRPLLSVGRRAMAPQPADRYASAGELGDEVERWLADEPVRAHRDSLLHRWSRFSRRHRALVLGALALLATVAGMLARNNWAVRRERDQKATALHDRQDALAAAERNQREALASERVARERLASGLVLSADGLLSEGRTREARGMLRGLKMSDVGAAAGLLDAYARSPLPLMAVNVDLPPETHPAVPLSTVSFARDGRTMLVAHTDGSAELLDLPSLRRNGKLGGHRGAVRTVLLSDDGRTAYTGGDDGTFAVWDLSTKRSVFHGQGHDAPLRWIAPAPDGKLVLTAGDDHKLVLWDVAQRKAVRTFEGHNAVGEHVEGLRILPDGRTVASGLHTSEVLLWDLETGKEIRRLKGHPGCTTATAVTPDGATLFAGSEEDVALRSWDVATGKPLLATAVEVPSGAVDLTPKGDLLLTGGADGVLRARNPATGEVLRSRSLTRNMISQVKAAATTQPMALTCTIGASVTLWDLRDGTDLPTLSGHEGAVLAAAASPDGLLLATSAADGTVRVWDRAAGRELTRFATVVKPANVPSMFENWGIASKVAFAPDGRSVFATSGWGGVTEWSVETAKVARTFQAHFGYACGLNVSGDGARVTICGVDRALLVWEPATGAVHALRNHVGLLRGSALSRDGKTAIVVDTSGDVVVWDVDGRQVRTRLKANDFALLSVALSPDDQCVATGGYDGVIRLWDLASGKPRWSAPRSSGAGQRRRVRARRAYGRLRRRRPHGPPLGRRRRRRAARVRAPEVDGAVRVLHARRVDDRRREPGRDRNALRPVAPGGIRAVHRPRGERGPAGDGPE